MNPIAFLIYQAIHLYFYVVFAWVILSMLISFNIINRYQPIVARIFEALEQLVEPALRPIRRYVPPVGGFDIAPVILFLGLQFIQYCIVYFSH
jgi:YggT family protein